MTKTKKTGKSVGLRPKPYNKPRRNPRKLADEPAMKALSAMIEAGEVDGGRTLAYLKKALP